MITSPHKAMRNSALLIVSTPGEGTLPVAGWVLAWCGKAPAGTGEREPLLSQA